jgi:hypothetical protein
VAPPPREEGDVTSYDPTAPADDMLSAKTRQELQRLRDQVASRRQAALEMANASAPPAGFVRDLAGERPASRAELATASRLLARHHDLAYHRPRPRDATA